MGKPMNEKRPKEIHRPKRRTSVGTVSSIISREYREKWMNPIAGKIILLGKDNQDKLRGYKAYLDLWADGEICLTITGLNLTSANALYGSMESMKDEEIHGE